MSMTLNCEHIDYIPKYWVCVQGLGVGAGRLTLRALRMR